MDRVPGQTVVYVFERGGYLVIDDVLPADQPFLEEVAVKLTERNAIDGSRADISPRGFWKNKRLEFTAPLQTTMETAWGYASGIAAGYSIHVSHKPNPNAVGA